MMIDNTKDSYLLYKPLNNEFHLVERKAKLKIRRKLVLQIDLKFKGNGKPRRRTPNKMYVIRIFGEESIFKTNI